ncbi:membrane hypothetical protein [Verrucomicrobia bacterium]|nr:membrane hypothetical protein [Verrucomicrobiota bacterium]
MSANLSVGPAQYRPSGRINLVWFIPWLFLAGATAGVLALLMHLAFRGGVYLVVLVPIAVAFALAGMTLLAVAKGHCRNPWLAGAVGLLAGLVTYLLRHGDTCGRWPSRGKRHPRISMRKARAMRPCSWLRPRLSTLSFSRFTADPFPTPIVFFRSDPDVTLMPLGRGSGLRDLYTPAG